LILLGDLNVVANGNEYNQIINPMLSNMAMEDSYADQTPIDPGFTADEINNKLSQIFSPGGNSQMRVDYMYRTSAFSGNEIRRFCYHGLNVLNDFNSPMRGEIVDLSDHYPLLGAFDIKYDQLFSYYIMGDWRFCDRCKSLFYGPYINDSKCPATNGNHHYAEGSSFNYALLHDMAPSDHYQSEWGICVTCGGLFYGPYINDSKCPATNGNHQLGFANFSLLHDVVPSSGHYQSEWRFCDKCKSLFYGPAMDGSKCPATNGNHHYTEGSSFNYVLPYVTVYSKI
jgi:hypothetical protein